MSTSSSCVLSCVKSVLSTEHIFLQVGAGPVGLVSALALAQNGVSIRIVDKLKNFDSIGQRGAGLMVRGIQTYEHTHYSYNAW